MPNPSVFDPFIGALAGITTPFDPAQPSGPNTGMGMWADGQWWSGPGTLKDAPQPIAKTPTSGSPTNRIVSVAKQALGSQYVWATEGPTTFDCSGLVDWVMNKAGYDIPRLTADGYYHMATPVQRNQLQPGDVIFYHEGRLGAGHADHINIYIGNGKVISADHPGKPITIEGVDWSHFLAAGRFGGGGASVTPSGGFVDANGNFHPGTGNGTGINEQVPNPGPGKPAAAPKGVTGLQAVPSFPDLSLVPLVVTGGIPSWQAYATSQAVGGVAAPTQSQMAKAVGSSAGATRANIGKQAHYLSQKFGVPYGIVMAVIQHESSFQQSAVSPVGAIGLMQLMPGTAKGLGVNPDDWQQNMFGGVKLLGQLYRQFGDWKTALAAYRNGPANWNTPNGLAYGKWVLDHQGFYH